MTTRCFQTLLRQFVAASGIVLLMLIAHPLWAQQITGTLRGSVTDTDSASIAGADVRLTNSATGISGQQTTNEAGQFVFNIVQPGSYQVHVSRAGFRPASLTDVLVEINKNTTLNVELQVGTVTESIDVKADLAQIETASARVATNVGRAYVVDLPSSTRNVLAVAELAPGVALIRPASQVMDIEGTAANVNGLRRSSNVYYMDGSDNTGTFRNTSLQFPNPEAVQEVQVSTAQTSAEFGKQPGGIFNVITKSGTNALHGSGYYFFRDKNLNANTWDRNKSGSPRPDDNVKQGGGTLGGPIRKDKTFFFGSYMIYRDAQPGFQNTRKFPTAAMVGGDFSAFSRQLYDPDTSLALAGNRIPARLLDPVAQSLLKQIPTVANFGDRYVYDYRDKTSNNEALVKFDHLFNNTHQVQGSYMFTAGTVELNGQASNNIPSWAPEKNKINQHTASVRHTWVLKPNLLLENRFSLAKHDADRANVHEDKDLSGFGANWPIVQEGIRKMLPVITVSDGFTGQNGFLSLFKQNNYRFGSVLSWVRGEHNFKFGGELQRSGVRQRNDSPTSSFNFDGQSASTAVGGLPQGIGDFGYAMADFVMGRISTFDATGLRDYDIYAWSYYFFAQDEWRITRRLTITPGLRYEFYRPPVEKNGRASAFILGNRSSQYPNAPVNIAFLGDQGVPSGFYKQDRNNVAPRLGAAYNLTGDGRTALRGGFGIYYANQVMNMPMWNSERLPWNSTATGGIARLTDPWGTSKTVVYAQPPTPFKSDVSNYVYPPRIDNLLGYGQDFRTPYTAQWNISLEREALKGVVFQAGYVANRGLKFFQVTDGNVPLWADNANLSNINARRPIANYNLVEILQSRGRSWYDSLQFTADVRRVKNLSMRFTYVYGKNTAVEGEDRGQGGDRPANPLNMDGEKAEYGMRQVARAFFVYDIPFLHSSKTLAGKMLGGWQVSGNVFGAAGAPVNVTLGQDWNFDAQNGDRPNVTAPIRYTSGSRDQLMNRYFDTSIFVNPAIRNTFGSLGRNAIIGPGSFSMNGALLKDFRLNEHRYFQFRIETYNLTNHNNLANPVTTVSSGDFGRILTRSGNRTMQLGTRFVF